jgi:hypothetical protein
MTELEQIRSFRANVAGPTSEVRSAARARLLAAGRQTSRRPLPRGPLIAAAVGVAAAVAVLMGAAVLGDSASIVERAQAAIDPRGQVLHVVVRVVDSDGGTFRGESWVRPDGSGRSVEPAEEKAADCLAGPEALRCYDAERNVVDVYRYHSEAVEVGRRYADLPGFRVDQPQSIHRAFGEGYARLVGETEVAGRPVYEFLLAIPVLDAAGNATPRFDARTSPTLYLDRETYHPVAEEFPDAGSTTYYDTYEFLPNDAATRRKLELPTKPGVRVVVHQVGEGPRG